MIKKHRTLSLYDFMEQLSIPQAIGMYGALFTLSIFLGILASIGMWGYDGLNPKTAQHADEYASMETLLNTLGDTTQ